MEMLNEKETVIFKCAQSLLNVSTAMRDINPDVSQAILFLSDRLLKEVEVINTAQTSECTDEHCPDCGGIKQKNIRILEDSDFSNEKINPAKECNTHKADGSGEVAKTDNNFVSDSIKSEIRGMIDEIRGTL